MSSFQGRDTNFGTFCWFLAKTADTVTVLNLMQYLCISHACRYKLNILLSTLLNHLLRYVTGQCDAMGFKPLWNRFQMIFFKFFVYQKMFWCLSDLQSFVRIYCRQIFFMHKIWIILPFFEVCLLFDQSGFRKWAVKFKIRCMKKFEDLTS